MSGNGSLRPNGHKSLPILLGSDANKPYVAGVCALSIVKSMRPHERPLFHALVLESLIDEGLYWRESYQEGGQRVDKTDGKPFSTDFSFSRFLIQRLLSQHGYTGWAVYCDDDFMWKASPFEMVELYADTKYAVMVVKHEFAPEISEKMSGKIQMPYPRKNWSSMMLWNLDHPSNLKLTPEVVNSATGSWLHGFGWLKDGEIGAIPESWNWLVGHSLPKVPAFAVHFTSGGPWLRKYRHVAFADDWLDLAMEMMSS